MGKSGKKLIIIRGLFEDRSFNYLIVEVDLISNQINNILPSNILNILGCSIEIFEFSEREGDYILLAFGGLNTDGVPMNKVHVYDGYAKIWSILTCDEYNPCPRSFHSSFKVSMDEIVILGGSAEKCTLEDAWILRIEKFEKGTWTKLDGNLTSRKHHHSIFLPELESVFVCGGVHQFFYPSTNIRNFIIGP